MPIPLLSTKLYVPPARLELVRRPRLVGRLCAGLERNDGFVRKLTLISAPAGFGKTTLICEWLGGLSCAYSWLSLDENDNDPARFLAYLLAALQRTDAGIGQVAQAMLQAPRPPSSEALLTSLINDIAATPRRFVLVLDDYHLIHTPDIHEWLAFLIEHQPPQMHLVIASREEPPLPLARLRARGHVVEIRQADLQFTMQEFADLLRHRLEVEARHDAAELHRRASRWYANSGRAEDAVRHALAASDWEGAASLILRIDDHSLKRGEVVTVLGWFQALPESLVQASPRVCLGYSWPLILSEQIDAAEHYLTRAEQAVQEGEGVPLLGEIAMARAYIARVRGDSAGVVELSKQALALLPQDDLSSRGIVAMNLGMNYWFRGALAEAEQALLEAQRVGRGTGNEYSRWTATAFLNKIQIARGGLRQAAESCRRFVEQESHLPVVPVAHYDLGRLLYEWNDLEAAADHVQRGIDLARRSGSVEFEFGGYSTLAFIKQAQGDPSAAQAALQRADRLLEHPDIAPSTRMYNLASQVIVALGQGELDTASHLVERFPTSPQEARSFPDYLLLMLARARLLLVQGQREAAAGLLATAHGMACQAGWQSLAIQARALQAVAALNLEEALAPLAEALTLAEPEGYVRTFLDAGSPMAALLREAAARGIVTKYARRLLAVFRVPEDKRMGVTPSRSRPPTLTEPLSDREMDVLRLLADGSTYQEIAQALHLSINTVKTHIRNVYGKLGVMRRRDATVRAKELDILS